MVKAHLRAEVSIHWYWRAQPEPDSDLFSEMRRQTRRVEKQNIFVCGDRQTGLPGRYTDSSDSSESLPEELERLLLFVNKCDGAVTI